MTEPTPIIILGVAGGTGSGKTTVARAILEAVGPKRIAFIAQDSYYRQIEWDSPEHLARTTSTIPHRSTPSSWSRTSRR